MYRIFADDTLIYDSTLEDFKLAKGQVSLEAGRAGSFVFSIYPEHPYYDSFVRMRTIITVHKAGRIVFRGRVLSDVTDFHNCKTLTCEGELGFLQDSLARPFSHDGAPAVLFQKFIREHNEQVDEFKRFTIGDVTVVDNNDTIIRSSTDYGTTLNSVNTALTSSSLGGYIHITHGEDGTDPTPTIHWLADFEAEASQCIEFGENLRNYTKTVNGADVATAIVPLGAQTGTDGTRLTIEGVTGKDYLYSAEAVALRGWIIKPVIWDDITLAPNLLVKARKYMAEVVNQSTTIELNAIDLHLLDRSIESFHVCEYVRVKSAPHGLDTSMLCTRQTLDLLKPENDLLVLGYTAASFCDSSTQMAQNISTLGRQVSSIKQDGSQIMLKVEDLDKDISKTLRVAADGVTISDGDGNTVEIDGKQIKANTIHGDCIKAGTLKFSGTIEYDDLSDDAKEEIEGFSGAALDAANTAVNTANRAFENATGAATAAGEAKDVVSNWVYPGTTMINGQAIMTGTVKASKLIGGQVQILNANEQMVGLMTVTGAQTAQNGKLYLASDALELEAAVGDMYLGARGGMYALQLSGQSTNGSLPGVRVKGNLVPVTNKTYSCGASGAVWTDIWANNSLIQTSDKRAKKDLEYGLEGFAQLFDALKPISFLFNDGTSGRRHMGLGAQDIEQSLEDLGISTQDFAGFVKYPKRDEDGNDIEGEYEYALRYGEFIPLLIEQVQNIKKALRKVGIVV